ncbi:AAA family ATPase [Streptomyces cyaneofuscatus]|uniref:helix-turn-helix transcriptional regulator n=1 Tax=Streptomyces cyaneofuscatus TaxID=66883 RepID=UPI00381CF14B
MAATMTLSGRADELRTLLNSAEKARAGEAATIFLGGPAGVGKTALTTALVQALPDFTSLTISGVPTEQYLNYAAANRLIQSTRRNWGTEARRAVAVEPASTIIAAGGALISAIDNYRSDGPLVLVVEDAHLLDNKSLQALGFMLLRMTHDQLLTLVNTEHLYETRQATGLTDSVEGVTQTELGGLDLDATRSLLHAQGVTHLAESQVASIAKWSRGNPLYIKALTATVDEQSRIPERFLTADVPPSLTDAINAWCKTFPPGARRILDALAVLNSPASEQTLHAMVPSTTTDSDIQSLVGGGAAQWISTPDDRASLALVHPGQREALYASLSAPEQRALHQAAAQVLQPPQRWRHQVAALSNFDPDLAAELSVSAATEEAGGDFSLAAQYELGVAKAAPGSDQRQGSLLRALRLLVISGQYNAALAYESTVENFDPSPARSETLGYLDYAAGRDASAAERLHDAREAFAACGDDDAAARASTELASLQRSIGLGEQSVRSARYALSRTSNPQIIGQAQAEIAFGTALLGGPAAGLRQIRHLRDNPTDVPAADLDSLVCRGIFRGLSGNLSGGANDLRFVFRRHSPRVTRRNHYESAVHAASDYFLLGEWEEARRTLSLVFDEAQVSGRDVDFSSIHSMSASLYACQGKWEAAEADLQQANRVARLTDFGGPDFHVRQATATIDFIRQNWHGVIAELGRVLEDSANDGRARLYGLWFLPLLGVASTHVQNLNLAAEVASELDALEATGTLPVIARCWLRGRILVTEDNADAAIRIFRDGLAAPAEGGEPVLHRAMLRCDLASVLMANGQHQEARAHASSAEAMLLALGASPLVEWCRAVLKDEFGSSEAAEAGRFWKELTDREKETARLVGRGWTNKEIAAELFVSTKTVEYHLGNAFAKGALQNRRQLRDLMQILEKGAGVY